eukprot:g4820.t1
MGKVNRRRGERRKARRHNPTGSETADGASGEKVARSMRGLNSADAKSREHACAAVAHMFSALDEDSTMNEKTRQDIYVARLKRVERSGLLKKIVTRLSDTSIAVRVSALGAVRNMGTVGGARTCDTFVKEDAISALEVSLKMLVEGFVRRSSHPSSSAAAATERAHLVELLSVVCLLCEQSDLAIRRMNVAIFRDVLQCLRLSVSSKDFSVAELTSRLLNIMSDSNGSLVSWLAEVPEATRFLGYLVDGVDVGASAVKRVGAIRTRLHALGFLCNCVEMKLASLPVEATSNLLLLSLRLDSPVALKCAAKSPDDSKAAAEWTEIVSTQMTALEIVANLYSDSSSPGSERAELDAAVIACARLPTAAQDALMGCVVHIVKSLGKDTPPTTWNRLTPALYGDAHALRFRAMSCLGNMIQSANCEPHFVRGALAAQGVWDLLFETLQSCGAESARFGTIVPPRERVDVVASGLLWAMARRPDVYGLVRIHNAQDRELLAMLKSDITNVRLHACGIFSASAAASTSTSHSVDDGMARRLAVALCHAARDTDLLVASEALNGLFDLFGESDRDAIFSEIRAMDILTSLVGSMESRYRVDGPKLLELDAGRIEEAIENLGRFIEYKKGAA